jgi:hypothetical protein
MIENRIVKTELIKWREIKPLQPDNLKHIFNYKYIEDSILTHGFSMPFFVWQNGNDIFAVDGHSRIEVLNNLENVPEQLPATFINAKDRKEAIEILLEVFNQKSNPIANEVLTEWVEIEQISVNVQSLNVKIEEVEEDNIKKNEDKNESDEEFFIPDCIYNSNNIYDIPTLKLENQATELILPLKPYGAEKRTNGGVGTYHFYVDDYRFEAIWKNPINILKSGCTQIVEPNLSLFDTTPISYGLFLIYKKRWLSRFLQEKGYNVYADLNVSQKFYDYNVLGIPEGYNSFFTRGYTGRLKYLEIELEIAQKISGKKEPNLVVYGGSKEIKDFCAKHNLTYIKDFINDK